MKFLLRFVLFEAWTTARDSSFSTCNGRQLREFEDGAEAMREYRRKTARQKFAKKRATLVKEREHRLQDLKVEMLVIHQLPAQWCQRIVSIPCTIKASLRVLQLVQTTVPVCFSG